MRFRELFESDYSDDLRSEIITLMTAVSAEGIDEISTRSLLIDLTNQGYAVDEQTLLDIVDTLDIVSKADSETIEIVTSDGSLMVGADADRVEADRVDNLATKKAKDDIGKEL